MTGEENGTVISRRKRGNTDIGQKTKKPVSYPAFPCFPTVASFIPKGKE
jgi:hypothetical protein